MWEPRTDPEIDLVLPRWELAWIEEGLDCFPLGLDQCVGRAKEAHLGESPATA